MSAAALPPTTPAIALPRARFATRWMMAGAMSVALSLALFWLLYAIIHVTGHGVNKIETLPTVDFVRLKRDFQPEQVERRRPPPPPPAKQPAPPSKIKIDVDASAPSADISIPTNVALTPSGIGAGAGGPGGGVNAALDSDLIPLQRIPPTYPTEARRRGTSGYVRVDLTINPDGSVAQARVIEAKPKGVFEAAAVTAVQRWKFRPKTVDGKPVAFHGVQRIEFNVDAAE